MKESRSGTGYLVSALLGAIAGGIFVAAIAKAGPKMMSAVMEKMMSQMAEEGCSPAEM